MFSVNYKKKNISGVWFVIVFPDMTSMSGSRDTLDEVFDVVRRETAQWLKRYEDSSA